MGQIAFKFMAGALAGLLAWIVVEPSAPSPNSIEWSFFELRLIIMLGLLVGLTIGGLNGYMKGSRHYFILGLVLGAIFGAIGATLGYTVGGSFTHAMFGQDIFSRFQGINLPKVILARTSIGIGLGAGIGLAIGAAGLSLRRIVQGLIGGVLGGAIGGAVFDTASLSLSGIASLKGEGAETGQIGRALLCILIGAGVGLLIGVVERAARTAWVRLRLGRNEGREWVLEQQTSHIGRDERANIPLFGDANVLPLHATIVRQDDAYWLYDAGTPIGTGLNGQRLTGPGLLQSGSIINVGPFELEFMLRQGSAPARAAERLRGGGAPVQPTPLQAPLAQPTLRAMSGPLAGQSFALTGPVEIGREGSGIRLNDQQASRKHALIEIHPGGVTVSDLASTNGTFVNGKRITRQALQPGEELMIGGSVFRLE